MNVPRFCQVISQYSGICEKKKAPSDPSPLSMEPAGRRAVVGMQAIPLSEKEFGVLYLCLLYTSLAIGLRIERQQLRVFRHQPVAEVRLPATWGRVSLRASCRSMAVVPYQGLLGSLLPAR